jgi:hypothetical protein
MLHMNVAKVDQDVAHVAYLASVLRGILQTFV